MRGKREDLCGAYPIMQLFRLVLIFMDQTKNMLVLCLMSSGKYSTLLC